MPFKGGKNECVLFTLDAVNSLPAPVHARVIVLKEQKHLPSHPLSPCASVVLVSMVTLSSRPGMWRAPPSAEGGGITLWQGRAHLHIQT